MVGLNTRQGRCSRAALPARGLSSPLASPGRRVLAIVFTTAVLLAAFVEPVTAWVPSSIYEPQRAAPGTTIRVSVTPPCGGTTLYLWPGRAEWGVSYPMGPRDRHLVQVPLRTTDRPEWLAFVVPRVPAGWYTPFFDAPPGCPFMAAGSTDTQRFFEILPAQPDTSTARADLGSADPAPDRHGFVMGLAFIAALAFRLAWSPRGGSR